MLFQVDFNAATAIYRQLVDQVCHAAAAGTLKPRDPLPTIRPLAKQLHLNRNTVAKAYTELENLRVIKTIPGKGCFIEPVNTPLTPKVRDKLLAAKIDAALVTAYQLQIDEAAFLFLVAERVKFFVRGRAKAQESSSEEKRSGSTIVAPAPTKEKRTAGNIVAAPSGEKAKPEPMVSSSGQTVSSGDSEGWTPGTD
jgi:GntR family transcriptional regulator